MILAAIDIGSNAARLLISEVVEPKKGKPQFTKLNLLRIPLRLGMDVFSTGQISPERAKMVVNSMQVFRDLMNIYRVQHFRACATSAMRDAKNGPEIIQQVKKSSGIPIEIISGEEEASLVFENHIAESLDKNCDYLYVDVGGGSTELTLFQNGKMSYQKSVNIGTIRILNGLVKQSNWNELKDLVRKNIRGNKEIIAIGAGGNINKIFSMSKTKDGKAMSAATIQKFYRELRPLSVPERMAKYNLREDRADVLVPALEIYKSVMRWGSIHKIYVPKISVADGLIKTLYNEKRN